MDAVANEVELINAHLERAQKHARIFACRRLVCFDDAYSDALLGLLIGVRTHDPGRDAQLTTWLYRKMTWAMYNGLRERDWLTKTQRQQAKSESYRGPKRLYSLEHLEESQHGTLTCMCRDSLKSKVETDAARAVDDALDVLQPRYRRLLYDNLTGRRTLKDIGAELGVTESRVSQQRKNWITAIRKHFGTPLAE